MVSLREIAQNILNQLEGGRSTHNSHYSLEQIKFTILYYRALYINRDMRQDRRTLEFEQTLEHIPVDLVNDVHGFSGIDFIYRTECPIPEPVRLNDRPGFTRISTVDQKTVFPLQDHFASPYLSHGRFTSRIPRSFYRDQHIWITNEPFIIDLAAHVNGATDGPTTIPLQAIHIRGIFEKPEEVFYYDESNITFYDDNSAFPAPMDFIQRVTQGIVSGEMQVMMQTPLDSKHNTLPDSKVAT